jgi:hypothetical protein
VRSATVVGPWVPIAPASMLARWPSDDRGGAPRVCLHAPVR